jgi:hypothetical protein
VNIQKLYRGYRDRKATSAGTSGHAAVTAAERGVKQGQKGAGLFAPQKQKPKKANEINQPKTMLERYVRARKSSWLNLSSPLMCCTLWCTGLLRRWWTGARSCRKMPWTLLFSSRH